MATDAVHRQRLLDSVSKKLDAPCKGCEKRHVGCHGKCSSYKEWKIKYDNLKEELSKKYAEINCGLNDEKKRCYKGRLHYKAKHGQQQKGQQLSMIR